MKNPQAVSNCTALKSLFAVYSVSQVAVLWCGVPEGQVEQALEEATPLSVDGLGQNVIWTHPNLPCLEYKSRAIAMALEDGSLPFVRDDKTPPFAYVPIKYRQILGRDLKIWIEKNFPNDKPAFLFSDIESDTFQALRAECDALKKKLADQAAPSERSERTYQNIIAALLQCITGEIPDVDRHPSFASEAKLIETILEQYPRHEGLSQSTLQRKFAQAKRALRS